MSSANKKASSFVVAASMGAVEALKDQAGLCRWDYALRSLYNRAVASKIHGGAVPVSLSQATPGAIASSCGAGRAKAKRSEQEKLQKAYHLVCWGPN